MMGGAPSSRSYWYRLAISADVAEETLTAALEMCSRVLPVRIAGERFVEVLVDDPVHQPEQVQIIQTILADQMARHKLQASHQAEIDAEVIRIVKRVSGGSGVWHA